MLQAVTFDFWDTLVHEELRAMRAGQIAAWSGLLAEAGRHADPDVLAAAFDENWTEFERCWEVNAASRAARRLRSPPVLRGLVVLRRDRLVQARP